MLLRDNKTDLFKLRRIPGSDHKSASHKTNIILRGIRTNLKYGRTLIIRT